MMVEEDSAQTHGADRLQMLFILGFVVIFIGIVILFVAIFSQGFSGSASSGGIILIGPFPIVFGSGPQAPLLILLSSVLTIIAIACFVILKRKGDRRS